MTAHDDIFGGEPAARMLPSNEEAEQAFLGACLISNEVVERAEFLEPDHFFVPVHGRIFAAIRTIAGQGRVANPTTLRTAFEDDEALADVGRAGYLARLAVSASAIVNAADYARQIRDLWLRRQIIEVAEETMARAYEPDIDTGPSSLISEAEARFYALTMGVQGAGEPRPVAALTGAVIQRAEEAWKNGGRLTGGSTGIKQLDQLLRGLRPGRLYFLAARPGMGKTSLATQALLATASTPPERHGGPGLYFSLEMDEEEIMARVMAQITGVGAYSIESGALRAADFDRLVGSQATLHAIPFEIDGRSRPTVAQVHNRARRFARRMGGIGIVVIDHIGLMAPSPELRRANRVHQIEEITGQLKAMAKDLRCPVLALSQLSREVERRDDKRPMMSDLRDSGSIEQDADVVIFLYRAEYYLARSQPKAGTAAHGSWIDAMRDEEGRAEIIVAKHRGGPEGTRTVWFDKTLTRFSDGPPEPTVPDMLSGVHS